MSDVKKDAQEFIKKMESGQFDGKLSAELHELSCEQLLVLASILMERNPLPPESSTIEPASDGTSAGISSGPLTTKIGSCEV